MVKLNLGEIVIDCFAIIAGTEKITNKVIVIVAYLKTISRIGLGFEIVDLMATEKMLKNHVRNQIPFGISYHFTKS
tara:strand:+ start:559 stop:786 length:228 start_codon:yes stop_codon:yes gene_type:complete